MKKANPLGLAAAALAAIAVLGGLSVLRGGVYADRYEGDMLHLVEIVLRIADGELPHLDFMTPIGILAVWPIAVFAEAGQGIGMAIHWGQILVALAMAPAVIWCGVSRFRGAFGYLFVVLTLALPLALVHGEADPNVSLSMHYNRWAWGVSFIALTLALLPAQDGRARPAVDGTLIGLALAAVVLIKITYFVALAPGIVVALASRGALRTLSVGLVAGVSALAAVTLWLGAAFWPAYVGDLIATATSNGRAFPGRSLDKVLTAPMFLGAHLLALLGVMLLRQGDRPAAGLALLVLFPGLVYVTYQNFGNDPQWLLWAGLFLLMTRPVAGTTNPWGWDLRTAQSLVAVAMLAIVSPSILNMAYSPFRHYATDTTKFVKIFQHSAQHDDFFTTAERAYQVNMQIAGERPGGGLEAFAAKAGRETLGNTEATVNGETFEVCSLNNGLIAWFETVARNLEAAGYAENTQILTADLLSSLPLFSDGIDWLEEGAPWRYGGAPGAANADYVLVPRCAVNGRSRRAILEQIAGDGVPLSEVYRDPLIVLFKPGPKASAPADPAFDQVSSAASTR